VPQWMLGQPLAYPGTLDCRRLAAFAVRRDSGGDLALASASLIHACKFCKKTGPGTRHARLDPAFAKPFGKPPDFRVHGASDRFKVVAAKKRRHPGHKPATPGHAAGMPLPAAALAGTTPATAVFLPI
jgi:hypothetical protein